MHHTGPISGIATFDEKLVATAGYDNKVILWSADKKTPIAQVFHDHLANQCAFSPDGKLLVSSSSDYSARVWSVPDMRLLSVLSRHDDDVEMASFSPDGGSIATCSRDHRICVYDRGGQHLQTLKGHEADVISVTWTPDSSELISSSDDGTIRRWSASTGEQIGLIDMKGVETDTVITTADGLIYSGDDEGRITMLSGDEAHTIGAHAAGIKRLVYSPRFGLIASLSYDKTLCIWTIGDDGRLSLKQRATFPQIVWPRSGAFLDRNQLVFGTFGSSYATYAIDSDRWATGDIVADSSINAVCFLSDGREARIGDAGLCQISDGTAVKVPSLCNFLKPFGPMLLTGGQTGEIFDAMTGRSLHRHRSPINCAATFRRDGALYAVVGAYTGEGIVFRLSDDRADAIHVADIELHSNAVKGVACDDGTIFSVSADGSCAWHDTATLERVAFNGSAHDKIANGCATLGHGVFASVSRDLKLRVWRGTEVEVYDTPHTNSIKCIAASDDGRYVATGSYFGRVAVFDVLETRWVLDVRPSASGISSLCTVPGGRAFACSSYDGVTHRVDLPAPA